MGYDLHITRQKDWFEENNSQKISIDEWKNYLAIDEEMRRDDFAEATTTSGDSLRMEEEGLAVWIKYSADGINGNHAWFSYSNGNIVVKNPDHEIVNKMLEIASRLNAKVQGDDGEIYERTVDGQIVHKHTTDAGSMAERQKPWWKFW